MKIERKSTVKEAAEQAHAILHMQVGEPIEIATAALTRIADLNLDARASSRVIEELNNLAGTLFNELRESSTRVKRLAATLERFEGRIA